MTSLGRALADALAIPHHDADDYLWRPTTPPYSQMREPADRLRLMREMFLERADWVLSGSLAGWGDPIIPLFDLVIFLYAPTAVPLAAFACSGSEALRRRCRRCRRLASPGNRRIH